MVTITGEPVPSQHMEAQLRRERGIVRPPDATVGMQMASPDAVAGSPEKVAQARQHHSATIYLIVAMAFMAISLVIFFVFA